MIGICTILTRGSRGLMENRMETAKVEQGIYGSFPK